MQLQQIRQNAIELGKQLEQERKDLLEQVTSNCNIGMTADQLHSYANKLARIEKTQHGISAKLTTLTLIEEG